MLLWNPLGTPGTKIINITFFCCFLLILLFIHLCFPSSLLCQRCYLLAIKVLVCLKLHWVQYSPFDNVLKPVFAEEYKRACTKQCFLWHSHLASGVVIRIANEPSGLNSKYLLCFGLIPEQENNKRVDFFTVLNMKTISTSW